MVKGFVLPDLTASLQGTIDQMGRTAFDSLHDLEDANRSVVIRKRRENQVNVIGHDDGAVKIETFTVPPQARFQGDAACFGWKDPAMVSRESREDCRVIFLEVRKVTAVGVEALHDAGIARRGRIETR